MSSMFLPPMDFNISSVSSYENLGSLASIHIKNLSSEKLLNCLLTNKGWFHRGSLFKIILPKTAVNAEKRIVNSNMTGKKAGNVVILAGLSWTIVGYISTWVRYWREKAVTVPIVPPTNTHQERMDFFNPIAPSIPWIGNGEWTSQSLKPASRTFSAAW